MKARLFCGLVSLGLMVGCASHRDSVTYVSAYLRPLASPGGKFGALPPAVQNTVRAETGSAEIEDVVTIHRADQTSYEIYFRDDGILPPLLVSSIGSVLNPDFSVAVSAPSEASKSATPPSITRVQRIELASPVVRTIDERAAGAAIQSIDRATWGDRAIYIITFADEREHPKLYITGDGVVLKDSAKY
jgi:hypothetical protein